MRAEPDRDFFLLTGIEWAAVAATSADEALRATAAVLAREAAYCHLLFRAGKHAAVLARLRAVYEEVVGVRLPEPNSRRPTPGAAETLAAAADLFDRLRRAVGAFETAA
jgi:hypothetical protein